MGLLPSLLAGLRAVCATFPDPRKGRSGNIAMADFGLAAFALFFMQSASFLSFQRTLEKGQGRSNCQTLFGIAKIPSDNYIHDMLDLKTSRRSCHSAAGRARRLGASRRQPFSGGYIWR